MDSLEEESGHDLDEVARAETSENSRLVDPPSNAKMNLLNIVNNIGCLLFTSYIFYLCFVDGVTLFAFHPTCMTIGWLLLMVSAVNSVTPGDAATEWMPVRNRTTRHWILQSLALVILTCGFFAMVINKIKAGKYHFTTFHSCFGLSAYILALVTACGGLTTLFSLKFKKIISPLYIKFMHSTIGLITFSLGIVTIILALFSDWWKGSEAVREASIALLLAVMIMTVVRPGIKLFVRIRERITYIRSSI